jgi:hypothetical protein
LKFPVGVLGIEVREKTATLYGNGTSVFSATVLKDVASATVQLLLKYDDLRAKNRLVYIESARLSQKQLLKLVEEAVGKKFDTSYMPFEELERRSKEKVRTDGTAMEGYIGLMRLCLMKDGMGGNHEGKTISKELGLSMLGDEELKKVVEEAVKAVS